MDDQETASVQLTVAEAARRAGVSTKTIRRWLSGGRLQGRFDGAAYAIDTADLDRALTSGRALDVQPRTNGHVQSMSMVQELLDRLERQAGEIVSLRIERDQLADQIRTLQAPADSVTVAERQELETLGAEHELHLHRMDPPPAPQRAWWRFW